MGSAQSTSNAITVATNKDHQSAAQASGAIGQITSPTFTIASADRTAGATSKAITIGFTNAVELAAGAVVTINYPTGFIATDATAWAAAAGKILSGGVDPSTVWERHADVPTTTSFKIKVMSGQTVAAGTAVLITVQGQTLGSATAGSATGITVSAPGNAESTTAVVAQEIGGAVSNVRFHMSAAPLRAAATNVSATITFTTATVSIPAAGKITIQYPSGFFATSSAPTVHSPSSIASSATPTATSLVLTVGSAAIATGTHTVILGGLTLGSAGTTCSAAGISVSTSAHYASSTALAEAVVGGSGGVSGSPSNSKSPAAAPALHHAVVAAITCAFIIAASL